MKITKRAIDLQQKAALIVGLGIGFVISAFQLDPGTIESTGTFGRWALVGFVIVLIGGILGLYSDRKEIAASRKQNLTQLLGKNELPGKDK